jgi:hypothetical protein
VHHATPNKQLTTRLHIFLRYTICLSLFGSGTVPGLGLTSQYCKSSLSHGITDFVNAAMAVSL